MKEVMEEESRVLVGTYARTPVVLSHGKGSKLFDVEGREYLDPTLTGQIFLSPPLNPKKLARFFT